VPPTIADVIETCAAVVVVVTPAPAAASTLIMPPPPGAAFIVIDLLLTDGTIVTFVPATKNADSKSTPPEVVTISIPLPITLLILGIVEPSPGINAILYLSYHHILCADTITLGSKRRVDNSHS
jgi:hypothetical protein